MRKWYLPMIGLGSLAVLAYSLRAGRGPEWYLGRKDRPTEPPEKFDHEVESELERIQSAVDRLAASLEAGR
ncbi:MAG: hypothetical protein L0099_08150 [Acidobacteria bacterium]|nr:hypothetical protein [Acidobacteriota bacterium]